MILASLITVFCVIVKHLTLWPLVISFKGEREKKLNQKLGMSYKKSKGLRRLRDFIGFSQMENWISLSLVLVVLLNGFMRFLKVGLGDFSGIMV